MIKGFDYETEPLSDYERDVLVPVMIRGLISKVGKAHAVTNKHIVARMKAADYKISDARVRKVINHIRCNDLVPCLIATSDGYYIAETEQELKDYEESLQGREEAIRAVRLSINRQRKRRYGIHEQELFT